MASVIRYQKSRYWVAAFRDASGKQHRRTTRETSRKRALAVAEQFERVAKRQVSAARVRKTFSEFYREHYGEDLPQTLERALLRPRSGSLRARAETSARSRQGLQTRAREVPRVPRDRKLTRRPRRGHPPAGRELSAMPSSPCSATATTNLTLKIVKMLFRSARRDGVHLR